jgi:hypothetical protein
VAIACALKQWHYHKPFDGSGHLSSTPADGAQSLTLGCAWQASQLGFSNYRLSDFAIKFFSVAKFHQNRRIIDEARERRRKLIIDEERQADRRTG